MAFNIDDATPFDDGVSLGDDLGLFPSATSPVGVSCIRGSVVFHKPASGKAKIWLKQEDGDSDYAVLGEREASPADKGIIVWNNNTQRFESKTILTEAPERFKILGRKFTIKTGYKEGIQIPYACTLARLDIIANENTNTILDFWHCTYAEYDAGATYPTNSDSICDGYEPTISAGNSKVSITDFTDWSPTTFAKGDFLGVNVDTNTAAKWLHVLFWFNRTWT